MKTNFEAFIGSVKEKTGIDLAVFSCDGALIAGKALPNETVPAGIAGVYSDVSRARTLFTLRDNNRSFVVRINGATEKERNYAVLISELADGFFIKKAEITPAKFLSLLLAGELDYSQIQNYVSKFSMPNKQCFIMLINVRSGNIKDILDVVSGYGDGDSKFAIELSPTKCAYIKFCGKDSEEYHSSTEYAEYLVQSVYEEVGGEIEIFIGSTVKSLFDIRTSYLQAKSIEKICEALGSSSKVHSFKEYVFVKMLEDLPKYRLSEYLSVLIDDDAKEIFADSELIDTAEEFLENSLNLSETSRKLYLHRNTLTYRLDKIEKSTGLNLRKFSDAITFRIITILSKLVD